MVLNKFTAVFEKDGEWWIGYVEELPGANTQGATLDETRENLKDAVSMLLQANRELVASQIVNTEAIVEELAVEY